MAMAAGAAPDAAGTPVKRRSVSDILKYSPEEAKLAVKQMQSLRTKAQNGLKAVDKNYTMALREFGDIQKEYAEKYGQLWSWKDLDIVWHFVQEAVKRQDKRLDEVQQ